MMSIYTARETYLGRTDEPQTATCRALAWSEDDESAAEPLPYKGEDSPPAVQATRYRRSTLLYGIAAGFAAAAIGGLVLTVMSTDEAPATTSVKVTHPVVTAAIPASKADAPAQVRQIRSTAPTQSTTAGSPARAVPPAVSPQPPAAAPAPESQLPVAQEAPEAVPPAAAPAPAAPEFTPPGTLPPVLTPQQVPHPVGPPTFHIPTTQHEGITLPPVVTLPPMIPTLSVGGGH